jgi:hypothetical protein
MPPQAMPGRETQRGNVRPTTMGIGWRDRGVRRVVVNADHLCAVCVSGHLDVGV